MKNVHVATVWGKFLKFIKQIRKNRIEYCQSVGWSVHFLSNFFVVMVCFVLVCSCFVCFPQQLFLCDCILINLDYLPYSRRILDRHLADVQHLLELSKDTKIYLTPHVAVSSTARGDYFSKLKELPLRVFFHMLVNSGISSD